jgi:hypothetical protein
MQKKIDIKSASKFYTSQVKCEFLLIIIAIVIFFRKIIGGFNYFVVLNVLVICRRPNNLHNKSGN